MASKSAYYKNYLRIIALLVGLFEKQFAGLQITSVFVRALVKQRWDGRSGHSSTGWNTTLEGGVSASTQDLLKAFEGVGLCGKDLATRLIYGFRGELRGINEGCLQACLGRE